MAAKRKAKKAARNAKRAPSRKAKASRKAKRSAGKAKRPARKAAKRPAKKAAAKKAPARKAAAKKKQPIVGEGDYAASRAFLKDQAGFVEKNKAAIPAMGKEAEKALEGPEGDSLRDAEATAAARSRDTF
jgi:hypothetical protein